MSRCALFDDNGRVPFLPFTYSRPLSEMRFGAYTLRGKWECFYGWKDCSWLTPSYLRSKFPLRSCSYLINGRLVPDGTLAGTIEGLSPGEGLTKDGSLLAARIEMSDPDRILEIYDRDGIEGIRTECLDSGSEYEGQPWLLSHKWDLFGHNGEALRLDHQLLKEQLSGIGPSPSNSVIGNDLHIGRGAKVEHATLNTENGPIIIDEEAEVMEGALIRGPFYLGPHGVVKMGAKIYGPTTLGPYGKVGGEINNCVIFGYSNKAHDGFLGNSVIGEWCNIGADTNNSNLKNNYGSVKVWDFGTESFADSGLTFCGIFMGDHSKCGIDTMFNTGTTIGFSANVFDAGFPPKFIPSFFWGGSQGGEAFDIAKAKEVAARMRERRDLPFDEAEERIFDAVHQMTEAERSVIE